MRFLERTKGKQEVPIVTLDFSAGNEPKGEIIFQHQEIPLRRDNALSRKPDNGQLCFRHNKTYG